MWEKCVSALELASLLLGGELLSEVVVTSEVCLRCSLNDDGGETEAVSREHRSCLAVAAWSQVSVFLPRP